MRHGIPRKSLRICRICGHENPAEKTLDILATDPVQFILSRHDITVQDGNGDDVRQAVIGLLLSGDRIRLVALFASADDIECHIEGFDLDPFHLGGAKLVALFKIQHSLDCCLRVNFRIEPFENGSFDSFEVFPKPVDFEHPGDRIHETFVPFERLRAGR